MEKVLEDHTDVRADCGCGSHMRLIKVQKMISHWVYVVCTFSLPKNIEKVTPPTHLVISSQLPNPTPWGPVTCF